MSDIRDELTLSHVSVCSTSPQSLQHFLFILVFHPVLPGLSVLSVLFPIYIHCVRCSLSTFFLMGNPSTCHFLPMLYLPVSASILFLSSFRLIHFITYIYTTNSTLSVSSTCRQRVLIARASQAMWSLQTIISVCRFGVGVSLNPACCTYLVNFDVVTVAANQTQLEGRFDDQPCVSFFQDRGFDVSSGTADI